jgi:hypothetical protein
MEFIDTPEEDPEPVRLEVPPNGAIAVVAVCLGGEHVHYTREYATLAEAADGLEEMAAHLRAIGGPSKNLAARLLRWLLR